MTLHPGALIELDLEKPAAGGRMLARYQGLVVLVWGAIPGERVRARVDRMGKGVAFADTVDVLSPSPDRRPSPGDPRCGGNVLGHVAYSRQLMLKGQIVQDAFGRIARVPLGEAPEVAGSPETGYRMRARLHVHDGRIGFYREGTHQLCDAGATAQLLPSTLEWIARAEEIVARDRLRGLAGVELAENIPGDERACHLDLQPDADPARCDALADGLAGLSAQHAGRREVHRIAGTPAITDTISVRSVRLRADPASLRLRRDVRAFFQGNRFLLERLVEHVVGLVVPGPVVDLYAGVGLFGLSLAAAGHDRVTLVEGDPISGADLTANAAPFADGVRVERRSVEMFLEAASRRQALVEATVLLDPPRTGLSKEALAGLIRARPARVVYVSCDAATLARDARALLDAGYALGPLSAFDLFPNTAHVETVAVFTREA